MKYRATFTGRKLGAIGIFYSITAEVEGETEEQARLNLYERFEHIHGLKLAQLEEVD